MSSGDFLRIEREEGGGSRHTVVHCRAPAFSLEIAPDAGAPDKIGRGVLRRLCVPNSWAGDYGRYAKLVGAAQDFFRQSFGEPVVKAAARRFRTRA